MWLRNLGRDDRLVADRGREVRRMLRLTMCSLLPWPVPFATGSRWSYDCTRRLVLLKALRVGLQNAGACVLSGMATEPLAGQP